MNGLTPLRPELLGLIELDPIGAVLYARLYGNGANAHINGRNFYSEVAPFKNVEELRRLINACENESLSSQSFHFNCAFDDDIVPLRVLCGAHSRAVERSIHEILFDPLQPTVTGCIISTWRIFRVRRGSRLRRVQARQIIFQAV